MFHAGVMIFLYILNKVNKKVVYVIEVIEVKYCFVGQLLLFFCVIIYSCLVPVTFL